MKKLINIAFLVVIAIYSIAADRITDLKIIKKNLYDITLHYNDSPPSSIDKLLATFDKEKGIFADLNYSENNPANWAGGIHWRRLTEMALTYRTPSSAYFESNDLKNSIIKGVD